MPLHPLTDLSLLIVNDQPIPQHLQVCSSVTYQQILAPAKECSDCYASSELFLRRSLDLPIPRPGQFSNSYNFNYDGYWLGVNYLAIPAKVAQNLGPCLHQYFSTERKQLVAGYSQLLQRRLTEIDVYLIHIHQLIPPYRADREERLLTCFRFSQTWSLRPGRFESYVTAGLNPFLSQLVSAEAEELYALTLTGPANFDQIRTMLIKLNSAHLIDTQTPPREVVKFYLPLLRLNPANVKLLHKHYLVRQIVASYSGYQPPREGQTSSLSRLWLPSKALTHPGFKDLVLAQDQTHLTYQDLAKEDLINYYPYLAYLHQDMTSLSDKSATLQYNVLLLEEALALFNLDRYLQDGQRILNYFLGSALTNQELSLGELLGLVSNLELVYRSNCLNSEPDPTIIQQIRTLHQQVKAIEQYRNQPLQLLRDLNAEEKLTLAEVIEAFFQLGAYFRRWSGVGPYPTLKAETWLADEQTEARINQQLVKVTELLARVDRFSKPGKLLIVLSLMEYQDGQIKPRAGTLLHLYLEAANGGCIRTVGHQLMITGYYWLKQLKELDTRIAVPELEVAKLQPVVFSEEDLVEALVAGYQLEEEATQLHRFLLDLPLDHPQRQRFERALALAQEEADQEETA